MATFFQSFFVLHIVCIVLPMSYCEMQWLSPDTYENHVSPDDLQVLMNAPVNVTNIATSEDTTNKPVPDSVDCLGMSSYNTLIRWIFNMVPLPSKKINTHFYLSSRNQQRVKVYPGKKFSLERVDFKPNRKSVMIVHGFMSHSNASWVHDMTNAFLQWADLNVIAVDWSQGGKTWNYRKVVANTRQVGSDVTDFLRQLKAATGISFKDFHFVGHSLGAHISSYVSINLGGVARITGLDPAQPCFRTLNTSERLDKTDADFVDVIHTNGRQLFKIGFGLPEPIGHADFYPNGGMKQPGCHYRTKSVMSRITSFSPERLEQAICSHGRSYQLFTESLISNNNCSFRAHRWNLTYEGINSSLVAACDRLGSCAEMGIKAVGGNGYNRASGPYFVLTTEKEPYCPSEWERRHPQPDLLHDLLKGFRLDGLTRTNNTSSNTTKKGIIETVKTKMGRMIG